MIAIGEQSRRHQLRASTTHSKSEPYGFGRRGRLSSPSRAPATRGLMFGYACDRDRRELMPLPISMWRTRMSEQPTAEVRKAGTLPYLRPGRRRPR